MRRWWLAVIVLSVFVSSFASAQPQGSTPYFPPQPIPTFTPPTPAPPPAATAQNRPLLQPLIFAFWRQEAQAVMTELTNNLAPQYRSRVAGIPFIYDQNPYEINAFAGCDDRGNPFMESTEGLSQAMDAIAHTRATDQLFGTKTYETYASIVVPALVQSNNASVALPANIIPMSYLADPRRLSRAHEIWDELMAFALAHELAHHYLGHTGCANGQPMAPAVVTNLSHALIQMLPALNQPNEAFADNFGIEDVLDTGRSRAASAYGWNEEGGIYLLDFFARIERASGVTPFSPVAFLRSHPNSALRGPVLAGTATGLHLLHREPLPVVAPLR